MIHVNLLASNKLAGAAIAMMLAIQCQASLLECAQIPGIDPKLQGECALMEAHQPAPALAIHTVNTIHAANTSHTMEASPELRMRNDFHASTPHASDISGRESLLFIVFIAGLLGVLLVRSKGCSTK